MTDPRGSVIAIANSSGTVTDINKYDEYGAPAAGNVGRFQYTGQMWLEEAGLYHYKARGYHPELGRFLQTDPIGYGDGMNMYAYVGGDPVNRIDPTGMIGKHAGDMDTTQWIDPNYLGSGGFGAGFGSGGGGGYGIGGAAVRWRTCTSEGVCLTGLFGGGSNFAALSPGRGFNPNRPQTSGGNGGQGPNQDTEPEDDTKTPTPEECSALQKQMDRAGYAAGLAGVVGGAGYFIQKIPTIATFAIGTAGLVVGAGAGLYSGSLTMDAYAKGYANCSKGG